MGARPRAFRDVSFAKGDPTLLPMEAVILMGIPGSGKSTFFAGRLAYTHVRINLDSLHTRHRERVLLDACLGAGITFVVDNTNVTPAERARYIAPARAAGFRVRGYFLQSRLDACLARNAQRTGNARIPDAGVRGRHAELVIPTLEEGFDELFFVELVGEEFRVTLWRTEA